MLFEVSKAVVGIVAGAGAGKVVELAIKSVTPNNISKVNKVLVTIGSFGIGGLVSTAVARQTQNEIDEIADVVKFHEMKHAIKRLKKEKTVENT